MSAVAKSLLLPHEYLARERLADFRSEFYRGEMFAMGTRGNLPRGGFFGDLGSLADPPA
jgi:hypothetical protein